ncbi:MAG: electron transport complex subunit RsxC [Candidatus Omnitrophica bacterium]|nr:electron transport complex subunit RsxC [Candidatus Omnitrophota bacterium]
MEQIAIDYSKYRLKPATELQSLIGSAEKIFVLWCRKCFQEFREIQETECLSFLEGIGALKERVVSCQAVDFLCRENQIKSLATNYDLKSCPAVGVIACGIGIQVVAGVMKKNRVLALADSIPQSGNATSEIASHGIALGAEKCAGCAQCYLNRTGGICPIVNCAKSLVNGPCGGSKQGKCEVDNTRPCAWEQIYRRRESQRQPYLSSVSLPDHHRFSSVERKKQEREIRRRRQASFPGGVYPLEGKEITANKPIETFPAPERVFLYLSQHMGSQAVPLVKAGQKVLLGEKVAGSAGLISADIHASVSGQVEGIQEVHHPLLNQATKAIVIRNDGCDQPAFSPNKEPAWSHLSREELLSLIKNSGLVGLGGAMFPTAVKLSPNKPVDTLIVNGCECEPYLNADNRLMVEKTLSILEGAAIAARVLKVIQVIIGIEENKPEALAKMVSLASRFPGLKVVGLLSKYPQGNERVLVKRLLGRQVPEGGIPLEVGVVVLNVATCLAIRQAVCESRPLIERLITVSGESVVRPGNFLVRLGTPIRILLDYCLGKDISMSDLIVQAGGPMMGIVQSNLTGAVVKGLTGLTVLPAPLVRRSGERSCIKCGRCVDVCPANLLPYLFGYYGQKGLWDECLAYRPVNCFECGCCEYICPAKINLVEFIKKAKIYARNKNQG